jgi:hypothetical protein
VHAGTSEDNPAYKKKKGVPSGSVVGKTAD